MGNIVVTALWKSLADRTGDPKIVAYAQRLVTVTDIVFTGLGAFVVLATGMFMIGAFGEEPFRLAWLGLGLALFLASALLWAAVLVPIQVRQARLAKGFAQGGTIPPEFWRLGRLWNAVGAVATILPLVNVFLMVLKPS